jgi:hypothetical protein
MALPPSAWTFTNNTRINLFDADNDWAADAFSVALFTSSASIGPASTSYSSLTNQVANGNGYTTGGIAVTLVLTGTTVVTVKFAADPVWTGTGSGFSAYYAVLYANVTGDVICYCVLDSTPQNVVIAAGATLTIKNSVTALATLS